MLHDATGRWCTAAAMGHGFANRRQVCGPTSAVNNEAFVTGAQEGAEAWGQNNKYKRQC